MFRGQFLHSIDSKGRVSLPARYRDAFEVDNCQMIIITQSPTDPCLQAYPLKEWERLENKISETWNLEYNQVAFKRRFLSSAAECEIDRNGRVVIPQALRDYSGVEKDVLFAGVGRYVEIWSKPRWDEALSMTEEQREAFKRAVMETIRI